MSSTSVHLPGDLLRQLDRVAKRRGISRNRLITEACRSVAGTGQSNWPDDFFATERLSEKDLELLRSTYADWTHEIVEQRKSKRSAPF